MVTVVLRNRGPEAFKPKEYGDKITVTRKIKADGGNSYELRNTAGKKITDKKTQLKLMLEQFNIQIENPCSILMQDTSREFLHKSHPKKKYEFFLTATQLKQIKTDFYIFKKTL